MTNLQQWVLSNDWDLHLIAI